jgi:hypothetical protein
MTIGKMELKKALMIKKEGSVGGLTEKNRNMREYKAMNGA